MRFRSVPVPGGDTQEAPIGASCFSFFNVALNGRAPPRKTKRARGTVPRLVRSGIMANREVGTNAKLYTSFILANGVDHDKISTYTQNGDICYGIDSSGGIRKGAVFVRFEG